METAMTKNTKRLLAIAAITAIAILVGFAVDLIWGKVEEITHPDDFSEYISKYALEYNIPESVIYAVIKVESDFDPKAESSVGACGLMQMMPRTFEWLTSDEHLGENLHRSKLFDPEVNIKYGCYYLNYLYEKFDRNWSTAFAAYNGGEGNVAKWLKDPAYSDGNGNLTNIPFEETKNYVAKVNREIATYKKLYYQNKEEITENGT